MGTLAAIEGGKEANANVFGSTSTVRMGKHWETFLLVMLLATSVAESNGKGRQIIKFDENYFVVWRPENVWLQNRGSVINLKLNKQSGCGFQSIRKYTYGYFSMKIKLVPGNSAGVVVAYYLSSMTGDIRDEVDFEFLGNVTGQPWILQTNIYANGTGGREERIFLWFDPTITFHTYSVIWNSQEIVWYVDTYPIRVYRNTNITSATYPSHQPMWLFSTIWNGDAWATRGGLDKLNWTYSPFIASYSKFEILGCEWKDSYPQACLSNTTATNNWWNQAQAWTLTPKERRKYKWVRKNYLIYYYCQDYRRYPTPMIDCAVPAWD